MKRIIATLCIALAFVCCKKEQSDNNSAGTASGLLQHVWTIDSVMIYADADVFGSYLMAFTPPDNEYEDFRADGKVYSYGGSPVAYHDTSVYKLLSDNITLLAYPITNGVPSASADTGYILKLTEHNLMYKTRNAVGDWGRWVLKR
jgi:hypothetical protein